VSIPAPAVALNISTYAAATSYITADEYLHAPTAVDASNLLEGGSPEQNRAQLLTVIARASSWADVICQKVLAATVNTQIGEYRLRRDGTIRVPVDNTPLIAVIGVSLGRSAGALAPLTALTGLWLQRKTVRIPVALAGPVPTGPAVAAGDGVFAAVTYVNGYPNTTLAVTGTGGDAAVTVISPVGIYTGTSLTVYDDTTGNELITVAPGYVPGSAVLPLVTPLLHGHAAGISVTALPPAVKEAVIALTSCAIKTRGNLAMVMASLEGGPSSAEMQDAGALDDLAAAQDLLSSHRRVW
jgi:hypothetical protein